MPIDFESPLGQVRAIIPDIDESDPILSDAQLNSYLATTGGSVLRSAALALRAIANEVNLILKVVRTDDLGTNGPAVAAELRQQANKLDEQADKADATDSMDFYEVVPFDYTLEDSWRSIGLR